MLCQKCKKYIPNKELIKVSATYIPGIAEPIDCNIRCPYCKADLGKISWGKIISSGAYQNPCDARDNVRFRPLREGIKKKADSKG